MVDTGIDVRDEAWRVARAAERRLDIQIRDLTSLDDQQAAAELLRRVWRADSADQIVNAGMMRAFAHSGNYVVGAFRGSTLVAVAVGFFGADHLHSHVTGVDPAGQSGGVGYAVKLHQRAWALARGVGAVCWTFDPLIRRNAYFNLHKLGARAAAYLPDFYGAMDDGINVGDPSDRMYIRWELASPAAIAAAEGHGPDPDPSGATILVGRTDAPGAETPVPGVLGVPAPGRLAVAVPADVERMRGTDAALAARWRLAVREAMVTALDSGYHIEGITRDGWYLFS
jgi:predicted GNAT superfamily acetyltransferase